MQLFYIIWNAWHENDLMQSKSAVMELLKSVLTHKLFMLRGFTGQWHYGHVLFGFNMWPWTTKPVLSVHLYWIDKLSIAVWYIWLIYDYLNIWNLRVQKKLINVVQIKAMHITNQKVLMYLR